MGRSPFSKYDYSHAHKEVPVLSVVDTSKEKKKNEEKKTFRRKKKKKSLNKQKNQNRFLPRGFSGDQFDNVEGVEMVPAMPERSSGENSGHKLGLSLGIRGRHRSIHHSFNCETSSSPSHR